MADRILRRQVPVEAGTASKGDRGMVKADADPTTARRIVRRVGGILKRPLRKVEAEVKRPLRRFRDYMNAPNIARIEGLERVIVDQSNRLTSLQHSLQEEIARSQQEIARSQQELARSQQELAHLQQEEIAHLRMSDIAALKTDLGYLHAKFDESLRKSRPVIRRDKAFAVPLADGYIFIPDEEEVLLLMYTGAGSDGLEPGVRSILQTIAEPGDHVIDVGASVGLHTLAMARAVGPNGRVDAFEAEPRLAPVLRRTLAVNGLSQVRLHSVAVGAEDGRASFHVAQTIGHSSLYDLEAEDLVREKIDVTVKPLDSVVDPAARVSLIKVDVEGAELDVIRGAKRLLENAPECSVVAECGPSHLKRIGVSTQDWLAEFAAHGFESYAITEPDGHLHRMTPDWVDRQESVNVLFLRSGSKAATKLIDDLKLLRGLD